MNRDELHILIERYFEADTNPAEEKELLSALLSFPPGDEEVDETLAVMGYARLRPRRKASPRHGYFRKITSAAAVAIALTAICLAFFFGNIRSDAGECYAYVGGERIENGEVIRQLMDGQLEEMSDASEDIGREIDADLDEFRGLLDS